MFHRLNERAREAMERATKKAQDLHQPLVEPEHILAGLAEETNDTSFHSLLRDFDVQSKEVVAEAAQAIGGDGGGAWAKACAKDPLARAEAETPSFSDQAKKVLEYAVEEADRLGHKRVGTSHFLLGLLRREIDWAEDGAGGALARFGLSLDHVRSRVRELKDDAEGGGKADVVPAILFYELDRRAREAEATLHAKVEKLETEVRSIRALLELAAERVGRLENRAAAPQKLEKR